MNYLAKYLAGVFLVITALYMEAHGVEYWGWVLFAGIMVLL
jgi:hypothetical protein